MYERCLFHPTLETDDITTTRSILWRGWRMELDVRTVDAEASCLAWRDGVSPIATVTISLPWGVSPAQWASLIMARLRESV